MKYRLLLTILFICSFGAVSFAQDQNIVVNISLENTNLFGRKVIPVKVRIINKSENLLNTETLTYLTFYFSVCSINDICESWKEKYIALAEIPEKRLKKDESFDFEIDLTDLYWMNAISSIRDFDAPKNFVTIPSENRFFYAIVSVFDKHLKSEGSLQSIPIYKNFPSNQILTIMEP